MKQRFLSWIYSAYMSSIPRVLLMTTYYVHLQVINVNEKITNWNNKKCREISSCSYYSFTTFMLKSFVEFVFTLARVRTMAIE